LKGLADSTDTSYGAHSVTFDTTGLDTLALNALTRPPKIPRRSGGASFSPLLGFHRAEGWIVGAGAQVGSRKAGWLEASGTYGFSNEEGRYSFGWRRTLLYRGPQLRRTLVERGRILPGTTRLDLEVRYARESLPFAPEHATPRLGNPDAWLTGNTSSSLYERRGFEGSLTLWTGDWRLEGGVRDADEQPMPLVNDFALFTHDENIPRTSRARTTRTPSRSAASGSCAPTGSWARSPRPASAAATAGARAASLRRRCGSASRSRRTRRSSTARPRRMRRSSAASGSAGHARCRRW
jgi:hypothetical protein